MDIELGRKMYERKRSTNETWEEVGSRFNLTGRKARYWAEKYYKPKGLPHPSLTRQIVGTMEEIPGVDPVEEWGRALRIQQRAEQRREAKTRRRIIYEPGMVVTFFMADLHLGGIGVDYLAVDRTITLIKSLADHGIEVVAVLAGDLIDNYIIGRLQSLRKGISPFMSIEEWGLVDYALGRLSDYLVASVGGNHDHWSYALGGVDILAQRHRELTPGIMYDEHELGYVLQIGETEIKVIVRHRWKGNSKYNPTHGIDDHHWTRGRDADVYVGAHTHRGGLAREFDNGGKVGWAIICGSYKKDDEYGVELGLPPQLPTSAVALICDETGVLDATSNIYALPRLLGINGNRQEAY